MNILVVCQYYHPEQFHINGICEQMVKDGHSVTVLTGLPNYPTGRVPKPYRWGRRRNETVNGVHVLRCFEIGRRTGVLSLALNYASYMLSASLKALFMKADFDIVFIYQLSPVTMALPGLLMKKRSGAPLYLYCLDIWPESIKTLLKSEKNILFRSVRKISKYLYSHCDRIAVTSTPFIEYFHKEHAIPSERISYVPQYVEDIYLQMDFTASGDIVDFVFTGNIGYAQDIECIIDAVEMIRKVSAFKVHFVGDGSNLENCKALVQSKGLNDIIIFHGRCPSETMPDFYRMADVCLLTLKEDNKTGQTMPLKLLGYMAAGKPVIGAINGAAQDVILESGCGVCVNAGDAKALAEVMKNFIVEPESFRDFGPRGREYCKRYFSKSRFMETIENEMTDLKIHER